ncbi:MAG: DUF542 domain-containing protein [Solirubrobacterales bacterium]
MDTLIETDASLGALAAERPDRIRIFELLGLDYCCGGSQSLAAACEGRGLDSVTVRTLLEAIEGDDTSALTAEERDWRHAGIGELCEHIVAVHHERLRQELPQIAEMLATVVRVHGPDRPELEMIDRAFTELRGELEPHLVEEEQFLFPACRTVERRGPGAGLDLAEVDRHEAEHSEVGRRLSVLRELGGGYDEAEALCSTHRALLASLQEFEADLHRHVHEENNVLFPRVRALASDAAMASDGSGQ